MTLRRPAPMRDLDWPPARARAFLDGAADLWQDLLERLPDEPVVRRWTAAEVREAVTMDVPEAPMGDDDLLAHLRAVILERSAYLGHPRFMAYVSGSGTVPGAVADLLASGVNMNVGGWVLSPSATEIELHLCRWFAREVFGLPEGSGGEITSGGAMATFIALKTARDRRAGWDVRHQGVAAGPPLVLYLSEETHVVSDRAADMLGIGLDQVRHVPVVDYRMSVDALAERIEEDRAAGMTPFAVVGTAGTTATGAVDALDEIADVCSDRGLWFHVDAAYGGPAMLAEDLRPLFAGIDRADSIAFDPHKWLYTPHAGGCVLVRDVDDLVGSFDMYASYTVQDKETTQHGLDLGRLGPNFSRSFWALKVWVSLLAHGRAAYGRRISHDAELARYLGALVEEREDLELMAPVGLSVTCFRYVPPGLPADDPEARETYLGRLNQRIMTEVHLDGRVFFSNAILQDRFVLRTCIVNFRTEAEDMEAVVETTVELGAALDAELRPEALR
jgi:aromatic-L-amino-acid/L-tryptophan decarboxylase